MNENTTIEDYLKNIGHTNLSMHELKEIIDEVAKEMGIKELWPTHPQVDVFFDKVTDKIIKNNG